MDKKMKEMMKQAMRQAVGITDEDFEKHISNPKNIAMGAATPELMKYKIFAEVTSSKYCSAGIKVGQKYTFQAMPSMLLPEECDCPLCAKAIGPIGMMLGEVWDKIIAGEDVQQGQTVDCLDPGIDGGGLGHVTFRVYAQKMA